MSVWVRLFIEGEEHQGDPVKISPIPEDINDLKVAVKKKLELDARLDTIKVYPDGTSVPIEQGVDAYDGVPKSLKANVVCSGISGLTYDKPLIVVAPASKQVEVRRSQLQNENGIPDHFAPILLNLAMKNMEIGWEKISESRTSVESTTAKTNSINFYGLVSENNCQVLGPGTKHVMNAHLWPHNNKENLTLIDLAAADIDNPKNVLRLHYDIEHKFDRFLLTFVPSGDGFVLEVLDPHIRNITLKDTTVTFQEIDGRPLLFPSGNRPWRRILGTHSILAHRKAREKGYLEEDELTAAESSAQESMDFSLDIEAQSRIRMFLRRS